MFDVRLTQVLQSDLADTLSYPQESRLHVGWQSRNLGCYRLVQDFDFPLHR